MKPGQVCGKTTGPCKAEFALGRASTINYEYVSKLITLIKYQNMDLGLFITIAVLIYFAINTFKAGEIWGRYRPEPGEYMVAVLSAIIIFIAYIPLQLCIFISSGARTIYNTLHVEFFYQWFLGHKYEYDKIDPNVIGTMRNCLKAARKRGGLSNRFFVFCVVLILRKNKNNLLLGDKVRVKSGPWAGAISKIKRIEELDGMRYASFGAIMDRFPLSELEKVGKQVRVDF